MDVNAVAEKPRQHNFKKFLKSRFLVIAALLTLTFGAFYVTNRASADLDSGTDISQVYQYYLLSDNNGQDNAASDSKSSGLLGNGGNHGSFSYSDLVRNASDEDSARKFSAIFATLSGYNYISTQSNGIWSVIPVIMHFLVGLVLLIVGLMMDIVNTFWNLVIKVIADYNVFTLIGAALGASTAGETLAGALNISTDALKTIMSSALGIFSAVIILTLVWTLRNGSKVNSNDSRKLRGRLLGLIGVPIVIIGVCQLLSDTTSIAGLSNSKDDPVYADWMMNVKDWAEKHNFDVSIGGTSNISAGNVSKGQYLDTSYNPYKGTNSYATSLGQALYNDGLKSTGTNFANSTMAVGYMMSSTFSSRDYLGYILDTKGSEIENNYGSESNVYNFGTSYTSTGTKKSDWGGNKAMKVAKDDYYYTTTDDKLKNAAKSVATLAGISDSGDDSSGTNSNQSVHPKKSFISTWADRYIYGAKNDGLLSKYYKETPSKEQIFSGAGTTYGGAQSGYALTYESTFLALSTNFTETGGTYTLDGPTYGAAATIAQFDTNRYVYYDYSMVGNPLFTIPAMLTSGLIQLMIGAAVLVAIWSVGVIDMNLKPLRSWLKSITMGDIEYVEATLVYGIGIIATIFMLAVIPNVLTDAMNLVTGLVGDLYTNFGSGTTALATEMMGTKYWFSFIMACGALWMFFKNVGNFRDNLVELLIIPWVWARTKGQQLEDMVNPTAGKEASRDYLKRGRDRNTGVLEHLNNQDTNAARLANRLTGGGLQKMAENELVRRVNDHTYQPAQGDAYHTAEENSVRAIRQAGANKRMGDELRTLRDEANKINPEKVGKDFDKNAEQGLNRDQLVNKDGTMNTNNQYITDQMRNEMNGLNGQRQGLKADEIQMDDKIAEGANGLTDDESKELQDLQRRSGLDQGEQARLSELNKKAADRTITSEERQEKKNLDQKVNRNLHPREAMKMQDLTNKSSQGALKGKELQEFNRLNRLAKQDLTRVPLNQQENTKFNELKLKQTNALKQGMSTDGFNEYRTLLAKPKPLSPEDSTRFSQLSKQANAITNQKLTGNERADLRKLTRRTQPAMNNAQKARYQELQGKVKDNMNNKLAEQYKQLANDANAKRQKINSTTNELVNKAQSAEQRQIARNQRVAGARVAQRQVKAVEGAFVQFSNDRTAKSADNLVKAMGNARQAMGNYGQATTHLNNMAQELDGYDFNPNRGYDMDHNGTIDPSEQTAGRHSTAKDTNDFDSSMDLYKQGRNPSAKF